MAKINYRFCDGHYELLEVTEEVAEAFKQSNREDWRLRKQRQRHETTISLTQMHEDTGYDPQDKNPTPEEQLVALEERDKLRRALKSGLSSLLPKQRLLLRQIYIENKSLKEISEQSGVTYQAVQNRHNKILNNLKKYFD